MLDTGWPRVAAGRDGWELPGPSVHAALSGYSWKDGCGSLALSWPWGLKAEVPCVWCGEFQLSAPRVRLLDGDLGPLCPSEGEDRGVPAPQPL